jgi:hypothetical protein
MAIKDFSYLKDWIKGNYHRPIILECLSSKSGMSMAVWERDRKVMTVQGCGFDRIGSAIGDFLETLYQTELMENREVVTALYGAKCYNGKVILEGMCGESSMREIGKVLGLSIRVMDGHSSTLIHITAA